eukprot:14089671-Alexandrium_andersonii.AAC.1
MPAGPPAAEPASAATVERMPAASSRPATAAGPAGEAQPEAPAAAEAARLRTPAAVTSTPSEPACNPAANEARG